MKNIRHAIYQTISHRLRSNKILIDVHGNIIHEVGEGTWWSMNETGHIHDFIRP
jgi:hypothetical protein